MNFLIKNKKIQKIKVGGFTLVETLVAISILSVSILAGFTAVQKSLQASITAKNQITAFYLIQDVMEYVKNVRDENALNFIDGGANKWLTGISELVGDPCYFGKTCKIDTTDDTITTAITDCSADSGGVCGDLKQDMAAGSLTKGFFGYDKYNAGWTQTNFRRSIQFQEVRPGEEVKVTVTMRWVQGTTVKTLTISQSLFNRLQ